MHNTYEVRFFARVNGKKVYAIWDDTIPGGGGWAVNKNGGVLQGNESWVEYYVKRLNAPNRGLFPTRPGGSGALYDDVAGQGVYVLRDSSGNIKYVGRGDAPERLLAHAKPGSGKEDLVGEILFNNNLPAAQAKSLENELMHMLGGPKSVNPGTSLRNKIQGIGESSNPNFIDLEFAAGDDLVIEALRRAGLLGR